MEVNTRNTTIPIIVVSDSDEIITDRNINYNEERKDVILEKLDKERHKMIKLIEKWDEKSLSKYVIPHPLLGKLSVREMLYFTILHTDHHRQILKDRY